MKKKSEKWDLSQAHKQQHQIRNRMMKNIVTFVVLQTNTRSLTSSDKIEELVHEIKDCRWVALLFSETWRPSKAEIWESQPGPIFMGVGKLEDNKHGVARFLNKKSPKNFNWTEYINERAIATSISANKLRITLLSVFSPLGIQWPTRRKSVQLNRSSQNPRKNANCGSRFQRWICSRYWNWTLQCWNANPQRIKQERCLVEAVGDVTEICGTQQDEQKDIWETSYIQDTWKVQRISWTTSRWTEYTWEAVKRQKQMTWYTWKVITGALWRILWFQHPKRKTPNTDSRKVLSPPAFVPSLRVVSSRDQGLRFDTWKMWGTHVFFGHPRAVIGSSQTFRQGILHTLNQSATGGKPPCETVPGDLLSKSEERS